MKHIVCFSGGHSSALVAIEVTRKFGKDNVVLLNHNINAITEDKDIKRFKKEVSEYLGITITYANYGDEYYSRRIPNQFEACIKEGTVIGKSFSPLCTAFLKTIPFERYLSKNFSDKNCSIYYGFDKKEVSRIQRRVGVLSSKGYKTDFPLALWKNRTIETTSEIGIEPPLTYSTYKRANCKGCLKAGIVHWYVTWAHEKNIFNQAVEFEKRMDFTINRVTIKGVTGYLTLEQLEPYFEKCLFKGVPTTEYQDSRTFVNRLRRYWGLSVEDIQKPCECVI